MGHTVVGIFKSETDAKEAVQQLINDGFADANVDYSSGFNGSASLNENGFKKDDDNALERFFKNLFGDDDNEQVNKYSHVAKKSDYLVTVHSQSSEEAERAMDILDLYGAIDVDRTAEELGYSSPVNNFSEVETPIRSEIRDDIRDDFNDTTAIPVVEEDLTVGKREVETGRVRVRSRLVERPVEENVRLRQEKVWVERNPVNRVATEADFDTFKEGELVLTESGEQVVVSKNARVVEEVRLGKKVEERTETVRDTVRKTEVDVDNLKNEDYQKNI